ncbi:RING-H2 finger protein ATL47, partial [Mucuna pruriens]
MCDDESNEAGANKFDQKQTIAKSEGKKLGIMEIVISLIILFGGIAVLVVIHVCVVGRAFRGDNNRGSDQATQEGPNMSDMKTMFDGDNIGDLNKLPCFVYEEPERGYSLVDCAVCLDNFKVGDACRLLPNCGHSFHVLCIDSWILQTPVCPICRTFVHSRLLLPSKQREQTAVSDPLQIVTVDL